MRLSAAPTFRDLGGVVANDGRRVRHGLLYRAGHLLDPSDAELDFVRDLRLRQVFDLRSESERKRQPSNWLGDVDVADTRPRDVHSDVNTDVRSGHTGLLHLLEEDCGIRGAQQMMLHTYRNFPSGFNQQLRPFFDALLDERGLPALVHCTAGKDRTGFACAMVLHTLGVSETEIIADYLRTGDVLVHSPLAGMLSEFLGGLLGRALEPAAIAIIMGVQEEFLVTALDAVRAEFGSIDAYLEQVAGMDALRCERLKERFLLPA